MLQKTKTHAIPLENHVTQQKLTETTENQSALTKTPNFGIFSFLLVHSALFGCYSASFRCHSGWFRYIPVPFLFISFHSGVIPAYSGTFRSVPVFSNARAISSLQGKQNELSLRRISPTGSKIRKIPIFSTF